MTQKPSVTAGILLDTSSAVFMLPGLSLARKHVSCEVATFGGS
jgi:hypothetical protein